MDVAKVIDALAAAGLLKPHKVTGNYMTCTCPLHSGGNEKKPSFGILLHTEMRGGQKYPEGWAHCFACGYAGTLQELISKILETRSIAKSGREWLEENVPGLVLGEDYDRLVPEETMVALTDKFAIDALQLQLGAQTTYISEEELASYRYVVPYMYERKLSDEMIEKFDVGYDGSWVPPGRQRPVPCITFPVRDRQGRTLFLCRRSIQGKMYNYPEGVVKPVYGLDQVPSGCKSLVICESCINAITSWKYGFPAVALLGTGNPYQMQQLRELGVNEFVLCMDGDEAGRRATSRLKHALSSVAVVWSIPMPEGKDLNDCSEEEFRNLYKMKE